MNAEGLSLRGGRRPTRRPEREARGSALGVQSREGTHDFADGFPVIQLGAARLPRRFAPRNDKPDRLVPQTQMPKPGVRDGRILKFVTNFSFFPLDFLPEMGII